MPIVYVIIGVGIVALTLYPFWGVANTFAKLLFSGTGTQTEVISGKAFIQPDITDMNEQNDTIKYSEIVWPSYGDQYGKLISDEVGLEAYVYWGDDYDILRKGVGTFIGSGIPGNNRTMLISGHNVMEFTVLQDIEVGNIITFTTTYGIYEYEVTDAKILEFDDVTAFDLSKTEEQLILYTCYPFTALGATSRRFFVYADRISGPDLVREDG